MKRAELPLIWLLLAFGSLAFYQSEGLIPRLQHLLSGYNQELPTTNLYVHTDKNIYMPGGNHLVQGVHTIDFTVPK